MYSLLKKNQEIQDIDFNWEYLPLINKKGVYVFENVFINSLYFENDIRSKDFTI